MNGTFLKLFHDKGWVPKKVQKMKVLAQNLETLRSALLCEKVSTFLNSYIEKLLNRLCDATLGL